MLGEYPTRGYRLPTPHSICDLLHLRSSLSNLVCQVFSFKRFLSEAFCQTFSGQIGLAELVLERGQIGKVG